MERLTKWCKNGNATVRRLAEYEDAEEKGLLIKLPCKVGDIVYRISADTIFPVEVYQIRDDGVGWQMMITGGIYISFSDFGKTVFLTPEAAQQALKENKQDKEI